VAKEKDNPTLAAHVAEATGNEREIESHLAAHLLLITRAEHHARLERHLENGKARIERLEGRLKDLGGSVRSVAKPSKPAKQVRGAAKAAERRASKVAEDSAKKVRDAGELRRVLETAREEQEEALKQTAVYNSLRALAKASDDRETAKLAKRQRDEHKEWSKFLTDELKSLSKKLVKAEGEERKQAASRRRSASAKKASSRAKSSSSRAKSGGTRARSTARRSTAKGSTAKRSTAKGSTAKGSTAKGSTAKRSSAKRS
jgi:ferritin-like metal-binding protein YciE